MGVVRVAVTVGVPVPVIVASVECVFDSVVSDVTMIAFDR